MATRGVPHLIDSLPLAHRAAAFAAPHLARAYCEDYAQQILKPVRESLVGVDLWVHCEHVVGPRAECIAGKAASGALDRIVMGSYGHGALGNVVMGSVATRVLALCNTPVLLIR